jgi:hypothetical protein
VTSFRPRLTLISLQVGSVFNVISFFYLSRPCERARLLAGVPVGATAARNHGAGKVACWLLHRLDDGRPSRYSALTHFGTTLGRPGSCPVVRFLADCWSALSGDHVWNQDRLREATEEKASGRRARHWSAKRREGAAVRTYVACRSMGFDALSGPVWPVSWKHSQRAPVTAIFRVEGRDLFPLQHPNL